MAELYYDANKTAPAEKANAVTPSDSTVLTDVRGLYVGADGDVAVIMVGDTSAVTLKGAKLGQFCQSASQKSCQRTQPRRTSWRSTKHANRNPDIVVSKHETHGAGGGGDTPPQFRESEAVV